MSVRWMAALCAAAASFSIASEAAAACQFLKLGEMAVDLSRGPPMVDISVNGVTRKMVLRTGAEFSGLRKADVVALGGSGSRETDLVNLSSRGQHSDIRYSTLKNVVIGGAFVMPTLQVLVRDDSEGDIAGVIGADVLGAADVEFDFANSKVVFYTPKDCAKDYLGYWDTNITEARLVTTVASGRALQLGRLFFRPEIQINGKSATAQLDSGRSFSTVDTAFAATIGLRLGNPESRIVDSGNSGGGASWVNRLDEFVIGGEKISRPAVHFTDLWRGVAFTDTGSNIRTRLDNLPIMLLGMDFMRSHRILVANSQRKMYFSHNGGPVFRVPPGALAPARPD